MLKALRVCNKVLPNTNKNIPTSFALGSIFPSQELAHTGVVSSLASTSPKLANPLRT